MKIRRLRIGFVAVATVAAMALAGCSTAAPSSSASQKAAPATVRVGIVPSPLVPPLLLGIKQGYFQDESLKIDIHYVDAGQAAVSGVAQGTLDVAAVGPEPTIAAASNGVPVRVIAGSYVSGKGTSGATGIFVPAGSSAKSVLDLQGKSIAVNALTSTVAVCLEAAVDKAGGNSKTIKFVEMPFSSVVPALERKQVDGAVVVEPFSFQAKSAGMTQIGDACELAFPKNGPMGDWITSPQTLSGNKTVIDRFRRALTKAYAYTNAHMEEAKASLADVLKGLSKADTAKMELTPYVAALDPAIWRSRAELLVKYGAIKKVPDLDTLLVR